MTNNRFLMWFAVGIISFCFAYFVAVTFLPIPDTGREYANTILGALIGSGFTTLIMFYWRKSRADNGPDISDRKEKTNE